MKSVLYWTQNIVDVLMIITAIVIIVRTFVYKSKKDSDYTAELLKRREIASIGVTIWFVHKIFVWICTFLNL